MGRLGAVLRGSAGAGATLPPGSALLAAAVNISNALVTQIFSVPLIAIQDTNVRFLPTERQDGLWPNTKPQLCLLGSNPLRAGSAVAGEDSRVPHQPFPITFLRRRMLDCYALHISRQARIMIPNRSPRAA